MLIGRIGKHTMLHRAHGDAPDRLHPGADRRPPRRTLPPPPPPAATEGRGRRPQEPTAAPPRDLPPLPDLREHPASVPGGGIERLKRRTTAATRRARSCGCWPPS